ncbi:MAG: hypothetical protein Q4B65_01340 [Candidatus Saccharibacteria bacterium]|nr:hypothetical protein [Candidatus Saccharibacteria bacterium]
MHENRGTVNKGWMPDETCRPTKPDLGNEPSKPDKPSEPDKGTDEKTVKTEPRYSFECDRDGGWD